ncbi:MAG TPA: DUF882 domain-containing protein [Burkholderiales bacterium]|nr:DUF882 domain-containing protein [Burkholderiales bacterium]
MNRIGWNPIQKVCMSRRGVLQCGAAFAAAALQFSNALLAAPHARHSRVLSFYHTHTGESARIEYWANGQYVFETLPEIDRILRDHYSDEIQPMDVRLLDLLHALSIALESSAPIHIISGYRSRATNAMLAARSSGVARHSLHIDGKAIDLRIPRHSLARVRSAALALRAGGVGHYPKADFVHLDICRVRSW